jgi:hypothetical protein
MSKKRPVKPKLSDSLITAGLSIGFMAMAETTSPLLSACCLTTGIAAPLPAVLPSSWQGHNLRMTRSQ